MSAQTEGAIPPVMPGLFRVRTDGGPVLLGGHCAACAHHFFPRPEACPHCQGAVAEADLGDSGTLYSHTTIRTRPPYGLPRPYSAGWIDLDAVQLRVFALLDPALAGGFAIGERLRLAAATIGDDGAGQPVVRPYFTRSTPG